MTERELVDRAIAMQERSYVPYSRFPVGAALECADGTVFTGCNVENSAYGDTICAERTAVVGNSEDYCWPCGSCRQVLYEFAPGLTVLVARGDGNYVKLSLQELLSHGFGPKSLE